jgi:hypothetical protein
MAKRHHFVWDALGLSSPPADADRDAATTTASREGDIEDAEAAASHEGVHGSEPDADEGPFWTDRFASPEELWKAFRNVDALRGRQANEIGQLRAEKEALELRLVAHEALVHAEIVRRKNEAREAGTRGGLASLSEPAGESPNGSAELQEDIPSPLAEGAATPAPESPGAGSA